MAIPTSRPRPTGCASTAHRARGYGVCPGLSGRRPRRVDHDSAGTWNAARGRPDGGRMTSTGNDAERDRLAAADDGTAAWRAWGPYVSERAWGTVREDYSEYGEPWEFFPHDHARSRTYRWNEDGMA